MSRCKVCGGLRNIAVDGPDPIGVPKGHPSLVACPKCQRARHERFIAAEAQRVHDELFSFEAACRLLGLPLPEERRPRIVR